MKLIFTIISFVKTFLKFCIYAKNLVIAIEKYWSIFNLVAEVSKPGQPRGTQDPCNRKSLLLGVRGFKSHPLHFYFFKSRFEKFCNYATSVFILVIECSEICLCISAKLASLKVRLHLKHFQTISDTGNIGINCL